MSHLASASVEPLRHSQSELPPRPAKSIQTFLQEREQDAWYWRALATLAASLIMVGFLIFPGAFITDTNDQSKDDSNGQNTVTITIAALVVVNAGYILSVALWFLRKNWVYQLDCIFIPCLLSSVFGFINSLVVPNLVLHTNSYTASALAAVIVSVISSIIYGLLSLFTWRRLANLKKIQQSSQAARNPAWRSDEELQRTQWNNLYQKPGENITAAQLQSYRTYNIDPLPPGSADHYPTSYNNGYGGDYHTM